MRIAVFGLGYVGTVTAAGLASRGHEVCGVDVDPVKVEQLALGRSPVVEPGLDELIAAAVELRPADGDHRPGHRAGPGRRVVAVRRYPLHAPGRYRPDLPATGAGGHPERAGGRHAPELRLPRRRGAQHGAARDRRRAWCGPTFADLDPAAGWTVGTAMCPEFLREGSGVADFFYPPFVVLGTADRAGDRPADRDVRVPGPRDPAGRRPQRGSAEVRVQRLPCRQGLLRQRDGPDLSDLRRRFSRR